MSSPAATRSRGRHAGSSLDGPDLGGRLAGDLAALDDFARELGGGMAGGEALARGSSLLPRRVNASPATAERDLAKLVLTLIELIRQLMERVAARRVNAGSLTEEEVERMGETFLKLEERMEELTKAFGIERDELNLNLGPLGNLL